MRKFYLLFILLVVLLSCSRGDDSLENIVEQKKEFITGYYPFFMVDLLGNVGGDLYEVILENDGNNYTKMKYSGILDVGGTPIPLENREDIISVSNNEIKVERKDAVNTDYHFIVKMKNGKMVEKSVNDRGQKDTFVYTYENQKLREVVSFNNGYGVFYKAKIHYNNQSNVDSILVTYHNGIEYNTNGEPYYVYDDNKLPDVKIVLSNYDNYDNPLRDLGHFDDLFLRSLSRNNFRKYERYVYDANRKIIGASEREWTLSYENGKVKF